MNNDIEYDNSQIERIDRLYSLIESIPSYEHNSEKKRRLTRLVDSLIESLRTGRKGKNWLNFKYADDMLIKYEKKKKRMF